MNKSFYNSLAYSFTLLIAFMPFVSFCVFYLFKENVSIYYGIMLFAIFVLLFFDRAMLKRMEIKIPSYIIFYAIFCIYLFISSFQINEVVFKDVVKMFIKNPFFLSLYIMIIIENTTFTHKQINTHLNIIKFTFIAAFIVTLIQVFINRYFFVAPSRFDITLHQTDVDYRYSSIFTWTVLNTMGLSLPIWIAIIIMEEKNISASLLFYIFIGVFLSIMSKGRYLMISYVIALFLLFYNRKKMMINFFKYLLFIIIILFIIYGITSVFGIDIQYFIKNRLLSESANSRILAFQMFYKFFPKNIFFGTGGIKSYELMQELGGRSSQIHVGWLSLLYYYGLLGGIFYILFIFSLMKKVYRIGKKSGNWAFFIGMVTFIFANMTLVFLNFYVMGIISLLIFKKYYEQQINAIYPYSSLGNSE